MEAAFFDLDKTLLPGSSLFPLAREMYRQGAFTAADIARIASDQLLYRLSGTEDKRRMARARAGIWRSGATTCVRSATRSASSIRSCWAPRSAAWSRWPMPRAIRSTLHD